MASKAKEKQVNRWMNLQQAAVYIGVSKETIYRLIASKKIPFHRIGRLYRFHLEQLDQWIISGRSK